jgi:hypothetical protein
LKRTLKFKNMSFWKNLLGISKKETQIIEEPEHDLVNRPPDDLLVVEKKDESNSLDDKQDKVNGVARQGESQSERGSSGGEGGLGHESSNKDSP